METISQVLSAATSLVTNGNGRDPARGRSQGATRRWWPGPLASGMQGISRPGSGGVARASLNHRL